MAALAITASGALAADIALLIGSNQDAFWNVVKKGAEDAAVLVEARGGSLTILQTQGYENYNTARSHGALGYRPPAPESIVPMDQRPTMH